MHTLHTTKAFILQAYPHGESSKTYKVLTREKGLLYVHGQGVRELKSKNRYALQTGRMAEITLVRGKNVWRITGARPHAGTSSWSHEGVQCQTKILHFIGNVLPVEDPVMDIFDVLEGSYSAFLRFERSDAQLVEVVTMVRLMDKLGFVGRPIHEPILEVFLASQSLDKDVLTEAEKHKDLLVRKVNSALEEVRS